MTIQGFVSKYKTEIYRNSFHFVQHQHLVLNQLNFAHPNHRVNNTHHKIITDTFRLVNNDIHVQSYSRQFYLCMNSQNPFTDLFESICKELINVSA